MDYKVLQIPIKSDDPRYTYYIAGARVVGPQGGYKIPIPKGTVRVNVIYHCAQEYAVGYAARVAGPPSKDYSTLNIQNWYSSPFVRFSTAATSKLVDQDLATRNHGGMGVVVSEYFASPISENVWLYLKPLIGYGVIYDLQVDLWIDKKTHTPFDFSKALDVVHAPGGVFAVNGSTEEPVTIPSAPSRNLSAEEVSKALDKAKVPEEKKEARKGVFKSFLSFFKGPRKK